MGHVDIMSFKKSKAYVYGETGCVVVKGSQKTQHEEKKITQTIIIGFVHQSNMNNEQWFKGTGH